MTKSWFIRLKKRQSKYCKNRIILLGRNVAKHGTDTVVVKAVEFRCNVIRLNFTESVCVPV